MRLQHFVGPLCLLLGAACVSKPAGSESPASTPQPATRQSALDGSCGDYNAYKNPYFGDLHVHTSYSLDAYGFGTRSDPGEAFLYAASPAAGRLDFSVVSDHSETFDTVGECVDTSAEGTLQNSPYCQRANALLDGGNPWPMMYALGDDPPVRPYVGDLPNRAYLCDAGDEAYCAQARQNVWARELAWAEAANANRCTFTSLPAYEWTASPSKAGTAAGLTNATLHRIVVFGSSHVPSTPLDVIAYPTPLAMLQGLEQQCRQDAGCNVITIPHNGNQSEGTAFTLDLEPNGGEGPQKELEAQYRARYERLIEIAQHKGSSECLYVDAGVDPDCAFENVDYASDAATRQQRAPGYVRQGLVKGLEQHASASHLDPFQHGFAGGTDNHNATPGNVGELGWNGHVGRIDDTPEQRLRRNLETNPGALTAAWAEENTRESIFAALDRRETYATSGPRMLVRFYQTWSSTNFCSDPSFPQQLVDAGGVPMGGSMVPTPGAQPRFVVYAMKDQINLKRIHIIKASVSSSGQVTEQIIPFDSPYAEGQATWCLTWTDAQYSSTEPAFYYARVFELPTWRWSHHDCETIRARYPLFWRAYFPMCDCPVDSQGCADRHLRERAWTSPIYHLP